MPSNWIHVVLFIFRLSENGRRYKKYTPKEVSFTTIKSKGVIIVKYYSIFTGYSLVIQKDRVTTKETVSKEIYSLVTVNDIIV